MIERSHALEFGHVADSGRLDEVAGDARIVVVQHDPEGVRGTNARGAYGLCGWDEVLHDADEIAVLEARLDVGAIDIESGHLLAKRDVLHAKRLVLLPLHEIAQGVFVMSLVEKSAQRLEA